MFAALSAPTKNLLSRPLAALYSHMSQAQNISNGLQHGAERKPVVIPFSSRLLEGRALAQDVWTVFKYVPIPAVRFTFLTCCSAANLPSDCLNLGQGYMNFAPPKWITVAAEEALNTVGPNHYSHPRGRPRLRNAIKHFYGSQFNRDVNVDSEIIVTSGANEGKCFSASFWHQPLLTSRDEQGNTPSSRLSWSMGMKLLCSNLSLISICRPSLSTVESLFMSPCTPPLTTPQSQPVMIGRSILKNYGPPLPHHSRCHVERVLAAPPLPLVPK
jgi:hypothetical protein